MNKYICNREVTHVEGHQVFYVEAETEEEAIEKFKAGEGEWYEDEYQPMGLEEYDFSTLYKE